MGAGLAWGFPSRRAQWQWAGLLAARSVGGSWRDYKPKEGASALRIWEGYEFRSEYEAHAKLFWEVCPKQGKREA